MLCRFGLENSPRPAWLTGHSLASASASASASAARRMCGNGPASFPAVFAVDPPTLSQSPLHRARLGAPERTVHIKTKPEDKAGATVYTGKESVFSKGFTQKAL